MNFLKSCENCDGEGLIKFLAEAEIEKLCDCCKVNNCQNCSKEKELKELEAREGEYIDCPDCNGTGQEWDRAAELEYEYQKAVYPL